MKEEITPMTKEAYKDALAIIEKQRDAARLEVAKQYAHENNPFKIGDIVRGNGTTVEIIKFGYYISFDEPQMSIHGIELKTDLTPAKRQNNTVTYVNSATLIKKFQP